MELYTTKIVYYAKCFFYTNKVTASAQNNKRRVRNHSRDTASTKLVAVQRDTRRTTAVHRTANREVRMLLCALRFVYYHFRRRFLSFWEALWGIRGVYAEYSWCIHGIYVCIGYVSGMYRVCIGKVSKETGREGGGMPTTDEHGWTRKKRI